MLCLLHRSYDAEQIDITRGSGTGTARTTSGRFFVAAATRAAAACSLRRYAYFTHSSSVKRKVVKLPHSRAESTFHWFVIQLDWFAVGKADTNAVIRRVFLLIRNVLEG